MTQEHKSRQSADSSRTQVHQDNSTIDYMHRESIIQQDGNYPTAIERRETFTSIPRGQSVEQPHITEVVKKTTISQQEFDPNLVSWDGDDDPANPLNWSTKRRWFLTVISGIFVINVTFASSGPSIALVDIAEEFNVSATASTLVTCLFLCGFVPGPLIWGPCSELIGRQILFYVSMGGYFLWCLGPSLCKNFGTLLVTRFFSGFFAASPLTNCGGVIADIWDPANRGVAMSIFASCVFIGPVLGPIVSGFVTQSYLGWRWVFWLEVIFGGACFAMCFFIPETYAPVLLTRKAKRLRKEDPVNNAKKYSKHETEDWSLYGITKRTLFRPFKMILVEPMLMLATLYISYIYGLLYATFGVFPLIWSGLHGFNQGQTGLIFIGIGIGTTLGAIINAYLSKDYPKLVVIWQGVPPPEQRLKGAMVAGPCLVIGLFWTCWCGAYPSVPWYVPAIGTIPIGMAFSMLFISFKSYIVDTYLMFAASALTANTMLRSAVGAGFPVFTRQMFNNLGIQWAGTLVGCLALLVAPIPFLFYRYGAAIRERSTYAPALDLKLKAKWEAEKSAQGSNAA